MPSPARVARGSGPLRCGTRLRISLILLRAKRETDLIKANAARRAEG
jgi:hypothetical protein